MNSKDLNEIRSTKERKRRWEAIWNKICWLVFGGSTFSFVVLEPLFFKSIIGFAIAVILIFILGESSELDTSEPDGGYNKAFGQGVTYSILFFIVIAWSAITFLFAIPDSNNFINVVMYLISVLVCGYVFLNIHSWLFPDSDHAGRGLHGCWVCEIEAHSENIYKCPFCGFVSKDKKRHGLAKHISNQHAEQLDGLPSFQAVCENCAKRDG